MSIYMYNFTYIFLLKLRLQRCQVSYLTSSDPDILADNKYYSSKITVSRLDF